MKEKFTAVDYIWRLIMLLWGVTIIFPIVWILYESLKTNQNFFQDVWALPETLNFSNYVNAWTNLNIGRSMLNTFYYIGGSLVIGTFLTTINAYALTRMKFRGQKLIWSMIMMSLFLPGINALVPQYILMRSLDLTNSLTGLIILHSLGESVFFLLLLSGFMSTIPKDFEESAYIDGASLFQSFWKIIVPLCVPGIVTVMIFDFMDLYNNFLGPFIYLSDPSKYTIGVNMYQANKMMEFTSDWVTLFAGVVITVIPSIVVFMLFQRMIMDGATLGGIKG